MSDAHLTSSASEPRQKLRSRILGFSLARRRALALEGASRGFIVGCSLATIVGLVSGWFELGGGVPIAAVLVLGSAALATALGWFRKTSETRIALDIDRSLGLAERVTTAVELDRHLGAWSATSDRSGRTDLAEEQIADTVGQLADARTASVYPIRQSARRSIALVATVILAIGAWAVGWPALLGSHLPQSQEKVVQQAEATRLEGVAKRLESETPPANGESRGEVAAQLRQAADAIRQSNGNQQKASSEVLRAEQNVASLAPRAGEDASLTLSRIADALNGEALTQPTTQALDQQNVDQAAAALNQLAASLPSMSADQRQSVARAFEAASNAVQNSDPAAAAKLQQAADAAKNGDPSGVQQAVQALNQLDQTSQAQHDVAQAQSELEASRSAMAQANQSDGNRSLAAANHSASQPGSDQPSPLNSGSSSTSQSQGSQLAQGSTSADAPASGQGGSSSPSQGSGDPGSGIGTGSAEHLGASHDLQGLAQRQITVPTNNSGDPGSLSVSNNRQAGLAGTAQVDYANVLPEYRQQAQQVIDGNVVPTGLKQVVKGYFDALAPK